MLSTSIGPLALSTTSVLMLLALLVAAGVGRLAGRPNRVRIGDSLSDMLIAGLLAARIGFVTVWFDTYRSAPWSMLDIRDGGFLPPAGLTAALLVAVWQGWRRTELRKPLALGLGAGALVWGALGGAFSLLNNAALPSSPLMTLGGEATELRTLAAGKPLVLNLWATWCHPCQREMPALAAAQKQETGIRFVFANQGEDGETVRRFLAASHLTLDNVLLDPGAGSGRDVGSTALPTTLFYDAGGRLVDTQIGGLSEASLASKLERLRPQPLSQK